MTLTNLGRWVASRSRRTHDFKGLNARRRKVLRRSGTAILSLAVLGGLISLPTAAAPAQANESTAGCAYAHGGTGKGAESICWIDFSAYSESAARSAAGQNYQVEIGGGYTLSFNVIARNFGTRPYRTYEAAAFPSNTGIGQQYNLVGTGIRPMLRNYGNLGDPGGSGGEITLRNIVLTGPDGASIDDFRMVTADSEATSIDEHVTFKSDKPLSYFAQATAANGAGFGCPQSALTQVNAFTWRCDGKGAVVQGRTWSNSILSADSPTMISQAINSVSRNAVSFGVLTSKVRITKAVESRVNPDDSFAVNVSVGNSQVANETTGVSPSATSGIVTVPGGSTITMSESAEGATKLSDYDASWQCLLNGKSSGDLTPENGATSVSIAPESWQIGDFFDCTVTNTAKPRVLTIEKTSDATTETRIGDIVTYSVTATNSGEVDYTVENPAQIVDDLTGVLDDADIEENSITVNSDEGSVAYDPATSRITWNGPIVAGESVTLTYKVKLKDGGDRNVKNVAFKGDPEDPEKPTPACDAEAPEIVDCEEFDLPKLNVDKTSDAIADVKPGDVVTYTVTATNEGPGTYTEDAPAVITDDMTGVLDDAVYQDDAVSTVNGVAAGSISFENPRLAWNGPLDPGESVVITYTVKLGASGDGVVRNVAFLGDGETPECTADEQSAKTCAEVEYPLELPGLLWQKVGDDSAATPLAGSEWSLVPLDKDGNQISDKAVAVLDCVADNEADCADQADQNPAEGGFLVKPLKAGDYQLVETKAPAGFKLLANPINVTISVDNLNADGDLDLGDIVNEQQNVPAIPLTGGVGTFSILLTSGGIVLAAAVLLIVRARKLRLTEADGVDLLG